MRALFIFYLQLPVAPPAELFIFFIGTDHRKQFFSMKGQGQIAAVSAQITSNKSRRSGHGRVAGVAAKVRPGGGDGGPVRPGAARGAVARARGGAGTGISSPVLSPVRERERARGGEDGSAEGRSRSEPHVRHTEKIVCLCLAFLL